MEAGLGQDPLQSKAREEPHQSGKAQIKKNLKHQIQ